MIRKIFYCISIHYGGGIVYLSMMHSEMDKKDNLILLDYRAKKYLKKFKNAKIRFYKRNLFRNIFVLFERIKCTFAFRKYLEKTDKKEFLSEYYFSGIPPLFRFPLSSNKIFVFCQNKNLFRYINYFDKKLFFKIKFYLYHLIHRTLINIFLKDTDVIIVQTHSMLSAVSLVKPNNKILIKDNYWRDLRIEYFEKYIFKENTLFQNKKILEIKKLSNHNKLFFYPAYLDPHKNHKILFNTFNKLNNNSINSIRLILTVEANEVPKRFRNNNLIIFLGSQELRSIHEIYQIVDFLIFPSINESLGLPLIEAKLYKLPIIASNLDYVYDICEPTYSFNPYSEEDIYSKILESIK